MPSFAPTASISRLSPLVVLLAILHAPGCSRQAGEDPSSHADSAVRSAPLTPRHELAHAAQMLAVAEVRVWRAGGSLARLGSGAVLTGDGIIATQDQLVANDGSGGSIDSIIVRVDSVDSPAHLVARPAQPGASYALIKIDRPRTLATLPIRSELPAVGDGGVVLGFPDGPGRPDRVAPTQLAAQVVRLGPRGERSRLTQVFVVRVDALEGMVGAPFIDRAGRLLGILVERVLGTTRDWVVVAMTTDGLPHGDRPLPRP